LTVQALMKALQAQAVAERMTGHLAAVPEGVVTVYDRRNWNPCGRRVQGCAPGASGTAGRRLEGQATGVEQ